MNRIISDEQIEKFLKEPLWTNLLLKDCRSGDVFLAIRKNRIDLYHKGGKLFSYDKDGFKTHVKYASVIQSKSDYLTEAELEKCTPIFSFIENYARIKENCSKFSGVEALGLATLYKKRSYLTDSNVVVLDIELSLKSEDEDRTQDRIDLVLYNRQERTLRFVEAKHFSNSAIWAKEVPKVVFQIEGYKKQVLARKNELIEGYKDYMALLKRIFEASKLSDMPEPKNIDDRVPLLIFGFDKDQKTGRLDRLVKEYAHYDDIKVIPIGHAENINESNIWS